MESIMKIRLQYFGGNGVKSAIPGGGLPGNSNWSNGAGTLIDQDPKVALGPQGKSKSIDNATLNSNPNYSGQYSEYSENCQRCIVAYEARRRGYDVTAQPTFNGDTAPYNGNWIDRFYDGAVSEKVGANTGIKTVSNIESKMAQYGEGARAVVRVQWIGGGGHVFIAEQKRGKTIYRDPQVGVKYERETVFNNVKTKDVQLVRTDNVPFTNNIGEAVTARKY